MLQNFTLGSFAQGVSAGGGSFESIASATGTGSSGTITFSSIPSTYQHLQLRILARTTNAATSQVMQIRLNNDSGTNYADHALNGTGTAASTDAQASTTEIDLGRCTAASATADNMGVSIIDIHDYASTSKNKTVRVFTGWDNNGSGTVYLMSGLWMSTSAVNRLDIIVGGVNFGTTSTFHLYGIKGA